MSSLHNQIEQRDPLIQLNPPQVHVPKMQPILSSKDVPQFLLVIFGIHLETPQRQRGLGVETEMHPLRKPDVPFDAHHVKG